MRAVPPDCRRFCQALAEAAGDRTNWWVSIQTVADRLGMDSDQATILAADCAEAGYVEHDQSQHTKVGRRATELPHSVTLAAAGRALLAPRRRGSRP